jgi:hypothetical protein
MTFDEFMADLARNAECRVEDYDDERVLLKAAFDAGVSHHHNAKDSQGWGTCDTCCEWEMKAAAYDEQAK